MRRYSMKSLNRRNHQRWLNAFCRAWNKNIYDDNLWRGRFIVRQRATYMDWFEDKSGGLMYCVLEFVDKKTNKTQLWYTNCLEADTHMFYRFNDFIVKDCEVWENEEPYKETESWR